MSSTRDGAGGGGGSSSSRGVGLAVGSFADEWAFNNYHVSSFMAMEMPATIVPRFVMDRVDCLGGSYGPFAPNYPVDVPLWLALYLRQTNTCAIQPPDYLRVEYLRDVIERERTNDQGFESLPFYFFEIAKKLTERGGGSSGGGGGSDDGDTIPHAVEVIRLVNEIHAMRQQKLKNLMTVFEAEGSPMFIPGVLLTNIVCHELHFLRASFGIVLQQAASMERQRQQLIRLPPVSAATPGRLPSTVGRTTLTSGMSTARTTTTLSSTGTPDVATTAMDLTSKMGSDSFIHDGVANSQISALTAATSMTTAMAVRSDGGPQPTATADVAPLAQPAVKKRRTLRQT
ncbi:GINS complex protein [Leishmania donovani]|uniref:GINS_complex_protein_putative/Pfam:PF05916 n=2 Tax=Leishmania donovani TaxID=5661 RepID=A0A6J8FRR4_LEIDO|nr:GINS complex protein [Leishmania donovani]VDZ49635.1 GINS_complex_protein_putative/Pfam:PF05916 [Leishmania donovani]